MIALPPIIDSWFSQQGWQIHPHQREMLDRADEPALLLIAPTGGGKTMAGFLPTLADLAEAGHEGLHTLYVSPLKALAADIKRNLRRPVEEMGLPIRIEDRTGDTSQSQRKRQRADPPKGHYTIITRINVIITRPVTIRVIKNNRTTTTHGLRPRKNQ